MLAKIIPHGTSFSGEALTYSVGDSFLSRIKIGQLVKIPYGKKEIFGIIAEITENEEGRMKNEECKGNLGKNFSVQIPGKYASFKEQGEKNGKNSENSENFNIKPILEIVNDMPILAEYQITTIMRIAMKYMLPIHKSLGIFLSEPILRRLQKYNFPLELYQKNPENSQKNFDFYISKNEIISPEKLSKFFKKNLAIILPDDIVLQRFEAFFQKNSKNFPFSIAFYANDITETKRSKAFIDIYNKKNEIIIGSRKLIQYNLEAYDEIWYVEDSFSREYYHFPTRINYTDFLAHMADSEKFSLKIFSSIPHLSTLSKFHFFRLHHF